MDDSIPDYIDDQLRRDNFFANSRGLAIIDCMMNIPLLFWAGKETGDRFFTDVAIAHADTTLHNFIRPDGSVCHAYRFDSVTGEPAEEFNDCGYSVGSHWARGTAWAVYGFSVAWRYTGLTRYRDAAVKLAECYLTQCGENGVPVWDFRLPTDQPARHCGRTGMSPTPQTAPGMWTPLRRPSWRAVCWNSWQKRSTRVCAAMWTPSPAP